MAATASREPLHPTALADSSNNEEYNLVLLKGRGKKRAFNNEQARLLSRHPNSGGWVSVQVRGGKRIKWRSKAWRKITPPKKPSLTLADLQDDCLVHIFSFLGAGEHVPPMSDEELSRDFSDEYLDEGHSVDEMTTLLSLREAMSLHDTVSRISKRFHNLCRKHLPSILGHLVADLHLNTWWRYVPWLTKNSLRLKSLKMKSELLVDSTILLYILKRCDVSKLTTLSACFRDSELCRLAIRYREHTRPWTMIDVAWHENFVGGIDLTTARMPRTQESMAADLGLPDLCEEPMATTTRGLHDAIALYCPSLTNLKLLYDLEGDADSKISTHTLFRKKTIRQLHIVMCAFNYLPHTGVDYTGGIAEIVRTLPNLKVLNIGNKDPVKIHGMAFHICSRSLQCIQWEEAGKANWLTRCVCPNLKRLRCLAAAYGNGVRPRGDKPKFDLIRNSGYGQYLAGKTRFDGTLDDLNGRTVVFEGLAVPDSCVVTLQ